MPDYICNKIADDKGRHEIHVQNCSWGPSRTNTLQVGWFSNCRTAISSMESQNPYHKFDGCYYCCNECHKG